MDDLIKNSINSRKDAIFNVYDVKDKELLKEIDNLFDKMAELGNSSVDLMDFETKLASSPLNQEYIDLFSKISQSSKYILKEADNSPLEDKSTAKEIAKDIADEARYQMKEATLPARRIARERVEGKLRSTPIIGDAMTIKQHLDLFGGFRRKKKAKEEQEQLQKELESQKKQD